MVYVDTMRATFGRMVMAHMIADTHDELIAMADKIGVDVKWIQRRGHAYEHFDITLGRKKLAIQFGAKEITQREMLKIINAKKRMSIVPDL